MLYRLRNLDKIGGKHISHMTDERMDKRQRMALAIAKAGFEVGMDFECPIKINQDKNLLALRMAFDGKREIPEEVCTERDLVNLAYALLSLRPVIDEHTKAAMQALEYVITWLNMEVTHETVTAKICQHQ